MSNTLKKILTCRVPDQQECNVKADLGQRRTWDMTSDFGRQCDGGDSVTLSTLP